MKTFQQFLAEVKKTTIARNRQSREDRKKVNPDYIDLEKGEFDRYPDGPDLMRRAKKSPVRNLSTREIENLRNTDVGEIKPGAEGRRKVRRLAKQYGRDVDRVTKQIKSKSNQPSIVHKGEMIAGNTRAMVLRSMGRSVPVIDVQ